SVHVNHLNRAVKQVTGKTTTEHIADRMLSEAKALLKFTDWNISMISYCLGFEEPAHFSHFFRKQTSLTPTAFRIVRI
ncbi:MAG: helix-turn-helix transcriptional regulator, partial [Bacteroidota bacterium]